MTIRNSCILVTGGCGAIGSEVVNRLKSLHTETHFVNLDMLTYAGNSDNIEPPHHNYSFVQGDIACVDTVMNTLLRYHPTVIIHLAAETHVDNSFGNSFQFTHTNVFGTHVLLECCKRYVAAGNTLDLFLHMSTDEVYGSVEDHEAPRLEDSLFQPSNPYAASKAAAEMICHAYYQSFGVPVIIMRCNNAISKYQHEEKLIPRIVQCILNNTKVPIHGEGRSKRTFIHAYDIADAIQTIIEKGDIGKVYNIGSDMEYSVLDVVREVLSIMRPTDTVDNWVNFVPDRTFQDYRYSIDASALRSLGWDINVNFHDALNDVIAHKKRTTYA